MEKSISIKGTREGLTVTLESGDVATLLDDLGQHLKTQGAFFRGGRVALKVGDRDIGKEELERIANLLTEHEMILRTVVTSSAITERASRELGLRLVAPMLPEAQGGHDADAQSKNKRRLQGGSSMYPLGASKGILVRHVVRSGQVIRHTGHVAVIGDVNVGGQVVAGGDIIIWGKLYGTAHAGAMGNESATICALELSPLQLRIGDLIARPEENDQSKGIGSRSSRQNGCSPEMARVRDNMIVVDPWEKSPRGV